nr:MAG: capsid protein [Wufeng shrew picorna-like virus 28]
MSAVSEAIPSGLLPGIGAMKAVGGLVSSMINSPMATNGIFQGAAADPSAVIPLLPTPSKTLDTPTTVTSSDGYTLLANNKDVEKADINSPITPPTVALVSPTLNTFLRTWQILTTTLTINSSFTSESIPIDMPTIVNLFPALKMARAARFGLEFCLELPVSASQSLPIGLHWAPPHVNLAQCLDAKYLPGIACDFREKSRMYFTVPWSRLEDFSYTNSTDMIGFLEVAEVQGPFLNSSNVVGTIRVRLVDPVLRGIDQTQGPNEETFDPMHSVTPVDDPLNYVLHLPTLLENKKVNHMAATTSTFSVKPSSFAQYDVMKFAYHYRGSINVRMTISSTYFTTGIVAIQIADTPGSGNYTGTRIDWNIAETKQISFTVPWTFNRPLNEIDSDAVSWSFRFITQGINCNATAGASYTIRTVVSPGTDFALFNMRHTLPIIDADIDKALGPAKSAKLELPKSELSYGSPTSYRTPRPTDRTQSNEQEIMPYQPRHPYAVIHSKQNLGFVDLLTPAYKLFTQERPLTSLDYLSFHSIFGQFVYGAFQYRKPVKLWPIAPHFARGAITQQTPTDGYDCTPVYILSRYFAYWSGSMEYSIQIVSTTTSSGRFMLTHAPTPATPTYDQLKGTFGAMLDLSLGRIATIKCVQKGTTSLKAISQSNTWNDSFQSLAVATNDRDGTSGYLWLTPLTYVTPTAVTTGSAQFTIGASAGSDFKFYYPIGPKYYLPYV